MKKVAIPYPAVLVFEKLDKAGFEVYVVGGAVRDLLLYKENVRDWDFTTNAKPEEVLGLFEGSFYDNNFGTVMVAPKHVLEQANAKDTDRFDGLDVFDITTYRSEGAYSDKRRPDRVEWGQSLQDDLKRRDFTVNAIAIKIKSGKGKAKKSVGQVSLSQEIEVEVVDPYDGQGDLEKKLVRAVGKADERFNEDALRMLRAIRLGAELGFVIDEETLKAIKKNAELIKHVSWERIRDEFLRIVGSEFGADGIKLMQSSGLLEFVLPELLEAIEVPQGGHHIYDVWTHMIESLRECPSKDPIVRLATLLHDVGKPRTMRKQGPRGVTFYGHEVVGARMVKEIAERLKLSKKQKEKLFILVRWHMFSYQPEMTDAAIRRFIHRVGVENINDMILLRVGDRKGGGSKATSWRLRELQQRIGENLYTPMGVGDLKIGGKEVMDELKIKPSKRVGEILNQLFEEVMDGKLENEQEELLNRVRKLGE